MIESDRLVTAGGDNEDEAIDRAIRPKSLRDYVGQPTVREQLEIFIAAAKGKAAVGVEVNANHLRSVRSGWVHGTATLHHEGGKVHVWHIDIRDEAGKPVCTSRLTVMLIPKPTES